MLIKAKGSLLSLIFLSNFEANRWFLKLFSLKRKIDIYRKIKNNLFAYEQHLIL